MAKLLSLLIAVGLGLTWLSQPVHAKSFSDSDRLGTSYTSQTPSGTVNGPVVKNPSHVKSGVTDDSVIKRAKKKPTR
jgi:hypothetical protein